MDESFESITLKNNIPIIDYKSTELLTKSEKQLSKFFKCCSKESIDSNEKCFWSSNDVNQFKKHIQTSHKSVVCGYCLSDKPSTEEIASFAAEDADQLIEHLIGIHGQRIFQCNICQFRATDFDSHRITSNDNPLPHLV